MKRGSSAMLTAALGLWMWMACGGRSIQGSLEGEAPNSSGGAAGVTTTFAPAGGTVGTFGATSSTPSVTVATATNTAAVATTTTTTATTSFGTTTGSTTGTTTMGAGGTGMVDLPPYVLSGAPLPFAPTPNGFRLNVVLSHGDPSNLSGAVFDHIGTNGWLEMYNPEFPAADTVQWTVDNLQPGQRYTYRIFAPRVGDADPVLLYEGSVVTQRPAGEPFSFLLLTDTHIPPRELQPAETALVNYPEWMLSTIATAIPPGEADFVVNLGDMLDFHDFGFNEPPPDGSWTRLGYLNYRRLLGDVLGHSAHFGVIGNWDGENGDFTDEQIAYSREQRLFYVPGPEPETYPQGGSAYEDYYAFTWGDALFVVLNVMSYTPTSHLLSFGAGVADDWTLGDAQMEFLTTTLSEATSKWKFLLIHHAVGGAAGDDANSAYGRGGGQAANVGEQAIVHQLMRDYGVQVFFYGHDHVFTDMVVDDVHYTLPGSAGAEWKFESNETGYTDYWTDSGYGRVEVSESAVKVEFINYEGAELYNYTLE